MTKDHNPFKKLKISGPAKDKPEPPEPPAQEDDFSLAMRGVYGLNDPRGKREKRPEPEAAKGLYNPFQGLAPAQRPEDEPEPENQPEDLKPEPEELPPPSPDQEEQRFLAAMHGVAPLDGKARLVPAEPSATPQKPEAADSDAEVLRELNRLVGGEVEFSLEFTDEYMHGKVKGLDPMVFQKLKNGRFSFEAHVDLHGMNADQAGAALTDFIRDEYLKGARCVLVVHGRGMNSPAGLSVLKHEVQRLLTREPLSRVVLAFVTALPRHGGAGAIYVLLRKYKKTKGKVRWDRLPPDGDLMG